MNLPEEDDYAPPADAIAGTATTDGAPPSTALFNNDSGELALGTNLMKGSEGDEVSYQYVPGYVSSAARTILVTRRGGSQ